jgi:ankyrin repeat protein
LFFNAAAHQRSRVVNETRKDGWTALMIASTKGEEELVRVLVENGAEVNKRKTGDGCTALMFAAAKGHTEIVRFLLLHHADVNTRNRYATAPRTHARTMHECPAALAHVIPALSTHTQ